MHVTFLRMCAMMKEGMANLRYPIRTKITVFSLFWIVLVGFFVAWYTYHQISLALATAQKNYIFSASAELSRELDQMFASSETLVRLIATRTRIRDVAQSSIRSKNPKLIEEVRAIFEEFASQERDYTAIYLMDTRGNVLFTSNPLLVGKNYGFRNYFKNALRGRPASEATIGVTTGEFGYYFSHPVRDARGEIHGVLVAKLEQKAVERMIQSSSVFSQGIISLTNDHGYIIYSAEAERIGKKLIDTDLRQVGMKIGDGFENSIVDLNGYEKKRTVGIHAPAKIPIYVLMEVPQASLVRQAISMALRVAVFVFLGAMIAAILIILSLSVILRPLRQLQQFAHRLSEGKLHIRSRIKSGDEIEELAQTMNQMASKLETVYADLDSLVEDKTKDLQKFQLAVEHASDQIVITDADGMALYANPMLKQITQYSPQEALGHKAGTLWGKLMSDEYYEALWKRIKEEKKIFRGTIKNRRKNGEEYFAELHIAPILDKRGNVEFFVAIERDVTQAVLADQMKTEFVTLASHQLRTPLAAIKWHLQLLKNSDAGSLTTQQQELADVAYLSTSRVIALVNELLNLSRIESGKFLLQFQDVHLPSLIRETLQDMKLEIEKHHVSPEVFAEASLPPIRTDMKLLKNVIEIVLSNAIKYSPDGSRLEISVVQKAAKMELIIRDFGHGISEKDKPYIFDKFHRGELAMKKDAEGTGIGLYMAKRIMEALSGSITFTSKLDKGTTFIITLPRIKKH